ncbi:MAG: hypothetical protein WBP22_05615 [Candidatus Saccharimonas sp.]
MPATQRSATVLYITTSDAVLVQAKQHEGREVYDTFGVSSEQGDLRGATDLAHTLLERLDAKPTIGKFILHIEKPDETVDLHVTAVCYYMERQLKANAENTLWITADDIDNESRLRVDDKLLLKQVILQKTLHMEIWESQMGQWIDAKVLKYTEHI